ncbi:phosphotransferase [Candidatus Woesearchaeota archaeon]|nr:phosphotransferase [Candidatus Woesearchaeota archaeon]
MLKQLLLILLLMPFAQAACPTMDVMKKDLLERGFLTQERLSTLSNEEVRRLWTSRDNQFLEQQKETIRSFAAKEAAGDAVLQAELQRQLYETALKAKVAAENADVAKRTKVVKDAIAADPAAILKQKRLGTGTTADVYRMKIGTADVAVKLIKPKVPADVAEKSASAHEKLETFLNEPANRRFRDHLQRYFGETELVIDGKPRKVQLSDFVEGEPLRAFGPGDAAKYREQFRILEELLQEANKAGIFHGDIHPDNILVRPDGTLVLRDFAGRPQLDVAHTDATKLRAEFNKLARKSREALASNLNQLLPQELTPQTREKAAGVYKELLATFFQPLFGIDLPRLEVKDLGAESGELGNAGLRNIELHEKMSNIYEAMSTLFHEASHVFFRQGGRRKGDFGTETESIEEILADTIGYRLAQDVLSKEFPKERFFFDKLKEDMYRKVSGLFGFSDVSRKYHHLEMMDKFNTLYGSVASPRVFAELGKTLLSYQDVRDALSYKQQLREGKILPKTQADTFLSQLKRLNLQLEQALKAKKDPSALFDQQRQLATKLTLTLDELILREKSQDALYRAGEIRKEMQRHQEARGSPLRDGHLGGIDIEAALDPTGTIKSQVATAVATLKTDAAQNRQLVAALEKIAKKVKEEKPSEGCPI